MVEPEPKIRVPFQRTQFVEQANCTNNIMVFSIYWTKSFWSRSQKLLEVGARAKNFGHLELESEPQPQFHLQRLRTLSRAFYLLVF